MGNPPDDPMPDGAAKPGRGQVQQYHSKEQNKAKRRKKQSKEKTEPRKKAKRGKKQSTEVDLVFLGRWGVVAHRTAAPPILPQEGCECLN
jgi:hypothetical protein